MDKLNSRMEMTEKRISKLEDGKIDVTYCEQQREKKLKKMSRAQETMRL